MNIVICKMSWAIITLGVIDSSWQLDGLLPTLFFFIDEEARLRGRNRLIWGHIAVKQDLNPNLTPECPRTGAVKIASVLGLYEPASSLSTVAPCCVVLGWETFTVNWECSIHLLYFFLPAMFIYNWAGKEKSPRGGWGTGSSWCWVCGCSQPAQENLRRTWVYKHHQGPHTITNPSLSWEWARGDQKAAWSPIWRETCFSLLCL